MMYHSHVTNKRRHTSDIQVHVHKSSEIINPAKQNEMRTEKSCRSIVKRTNLNCSAVKNIAEEAFFILFYLSNSLFKK